MRLPTLLAIPDYSAPKKGRGRTRTNYTKSLYEPAKKPRGRPRKNPVGETVVAVVAPAKEASTSRLRRLRMLPPASPPENVEKKKRGRPKSTVYQVPPIPKSPRPRGRPRSTKWQVPPIPKSERYTNENSIVNPLTGRRIQKWGALYYKLKKMGVLYPEDM